LVEVPRLILIHQKISQLPHTVHHNLRKHDGREVQCIVADPECLSQILIFSSPDLGSNNTTKEDRETKFVVLLFRGHQHQEHKIENYFIFELEKKKM
jgi:hypothetical protein